MDIESVFKFLVDNIHTVVISTVDEFDLPVTCAIDIMDYDNHGLYFLTARGKNFFERLSSKKFISMTGLYGESILSSISVSVRGKVVDIGSDMITTLFNKNAYMNDIYPTAESRIALTVIYIYEGDVEWFDLSKKPIERASFTFGKVENARKGYFITNDCIGCNQCYSICPQMCIDNERVPYMIKKRHCLNCGNCYNICKQKAVIKI